MANKKTSSNSKVIKSLINEIERYTKKLEKKDIERAKIIKATQLSFLAVEMRDKMNKALFKKLTTPMKRPQIKTLDENIQLLNQLKESNQKINVKSFNQKKKDLRIENETTYNVYIKIELIVEKTQQNNEDEVEEYQNNDYVFEDDIENYLKLNNTDIILAGQFWQTMVERHDRLLESRITHQTILVKGKKNIQNEVKKIIDTYSQWQYMMFVNLLAVHANKQILDDDDYRWQGAENQYKMKSYIGKVKKITSKDILYFKAWNQMAFKYHGYNLDMNNETKFECVPNALYKIYGNKELEGWKYDAKIANGGIEYVKKELDENEESDDEDTFEGVKGYTPNDIIQFCNKHKIKCFGFNWKLEQFITNKHEKINFRHDLPHFVFYLNDKHVYLIEDKQLRQSLLKSNGNSELISVLAKGKQFKQPEEPKENEQSEEVNAPNRENLVDISFDDWAKYENKNIYITENRLVHNKFYELICKGEVYNKLIKLNETDGIVRFQYKNKNTIIYNADYHHVIKSIDNLNKVFGKNKYTFNNQKLNTLAVDVLNAHYGGINSSTMNKLGNEIFHSEFIKNTQFNGWFSKPNNIDNIKAYDYNKHYTSCLMGQNLKFGWPVYNIFDEVKPFDGEIKTGFYFVETKNFFPFKGNGWYDADLVDYGLNNDIITNDDIKFEYKSSQELNSKYFEKFIKFVYEHFDNPKSAINKMVGCFGHDYKNKNIHHFTTDARNVFIELVQNKDAKVKYIYHDEFSKNKNSPIDIKSIDINNCIRNDKPLCYHVYNDKQQKLFNNYLPLFYKIYNVSAVKMHQMSSTIGGQVRGVFTDTIIFEGKINEPTCDSSIGGIRKSTIKPFTHCMPTAPRIGKFKLPKIKYNNLTEFNLESNKSVFITGDAGTGKSYKTNELKSELLENDFVSCTPTHKSALIIKGKTIYDVFNINPHDHTYLKSKVEKLKANGLKWVFIDEISMINSKCWAVIRDIKRIYKFNFVLVGDFNQLEPVEDITFDVFNSSAFHEICDGNVLTLTKNWRAEACPQFKSFIDDLNKIKAGEDINFSTYGNKGCRRSIAWTNQTRNIINNEWMIKESKGKTCYFINNCKVFVGLPIIANETRKVNKVYDIFNNEEFEVTFIDKDKITITNERINIDIKHIEFKFFDLAYCITVHKAQGSTFDFPFSIYDYNFKGFDKKLLYTAMSRSTKKEYVNFCFRTYSTKKGFVYKITNEDTDKIYIGSTTTSLEQRFKEHKESNDGSPLHSDMKIYNKWKIELVKEINFVDLQQLLISETCYIISHNSIENGYNTKLSLKIDNIY